MSEEKKRYIGPREVVNVVTMDKTTPRGGELLNVIFDGGHSQVIPKMTFDVVVHSEPVDYTELQRRKFKPVIQEVLEIMVEHNIAYGECDNLLNSIGSEVSNMLGRSINYLWTQQDHLFVPGINPNADRGLLEIISVTKHLAKNKKDESVGKKDK